MPEEVQSAVANSKRPAPDKRRQMIRVLVDKIRKHDTNPTRSECLIICRNIVKQYPSSSADMTPGGVIIGINVLHASELSIEESGSGIEKYLMTKAKNKDAQSIVSQTKEGELILSIIQLLMAYFDERREGLILFADMSSTAADIECTLTLPASPRLILLVAGDDVASGRWMLSIKSHVVCEGPQSGFIAGLAAVFATYYVFNLRYQEEAERTLEFIQRRFVGINPERGTKASRGKVTSKKTGKLVQKKGATVNPHVATLIKNLVDFEWGFM
ncbi:uncharacterized protein LOC113051318 [Xyrichtys novacula]|uniref:Uncharacterized protein LOC113051318 n=1 Tax=Xyrichtys novacula TaxID=13765 RepID=A0AAV1FU67_XYRNO|nr:uncharacterized protein LOC113051318 [Xyrichtys novacula]